MKRKIKTKTQSKKKVIQKCNFEIDTLKIIISFLSKDNYISFSSTNKIFREAFLTSPYSTEYHFKLHIKKNLHHLSYSESINIFDSVIEMLKNEMLKNEMLKNEKKVLDIKKINEEIKLINDKIEYLTVNDITVYQGNFTKDIETVNRYITKLEMKLQELTKKKKQIGFEMNLK